MATLVLDLFAVSLTQNVSLFQIWDQLIFIGGGPHWTPVAAQIASHMEELRPAFRRPFGTAKATATVERLEMQAAVHGLELGLEVP